MATHRKKDPLIWGAILIVIGLIFFLENFDIDVWDYVWKLWPVVLIVWGALKLLAGLRDSRTKPSETDVLPPKQA
jgi:hypothetical protein